MWQLIRGEVLPESQQLILWNICPGRVTVFSKLLLVCFRQPSKIWYNVCLKGKHLTQCGLFTAECIFCQKVLNLLFCAVGTSELHWLAWFPLVRGISHSWGQDSWCHKIPQEESRLHCKFTLTWEQVFARFSKYNLNFTLLGQFPFVG